MSPSSHPLDQAIEARLVQFFEQNYQQLHSDTGRSLAPDVRRAALQQVLYYWRRLSGIARQINATEIKLTLSGQQTPQGRPFAIEGVVDVVEDDDRTVMYDFKTHDADQIRADPTLYEQQLTVYAYVWQQLHGRPVDHIAIISTSLPEELREAIAAHDEQQIAAALARWQPIIPVRCSSEQLSATIRDFGDVVDAIEAGRFAPPPVAVLRERRPGMQQTFAVAICGYCDARFSCDSFRAYRAGTAARETLLPGRQAAAFQAAVLAEEEEDVVQQDRIMAALALRDDGDLLDLD